MGNYSRKKADGLLYDGSTFDPEKNYVAVRMQQGVPLLDTDWNEMNDVIRNEVYQIGRAALSDGVAPGALSLSIYARANNKQVNDFVTIKVDGIVIVNGKPLSLGEAMEPFTAQIWYSPTIAQKYGIIPIKPLITPTQDRTDLVYLDVWEREIDSNEDNYLKNEMIGIETSLRIKREYAVRVEENTKKLPSPPSGHYYLPLALLNRKANLPQITQDQIIDIRAYIGIRGTYKLNVCPYFFPIKNENTAKWDFSTSCHAFKLSGNSARGQLQLVLPNRARLLNLSIHVYGRYTNINDTRRQLTFLFVRISKLPTIPSFEFKPETLLKFTVVFDAAEENELLAITQNKLMPNEDQKEFVDNDNYSYVLHAIAGPSIDAYITRISIDYLI